MKTKAIIFDVDGTLVDSVDLHARAWREAFAHFGKDISERAIRRFIGMGGDQMITFFLSVEERESFGEKLDTYRDGLFQKRYLYQIHAFPSVPELFERLAALGILTALASSAKTLELEYYKKEIGIERTLNGQTSADDAENSKPDPDIFQAAQRKLNNFACDNVLVIGDSPYDMTAARKAGLRAIGVRCGGFPAGELLSAGAIALFQDPADLAERLPRFLKQWAYV